MTSETTQKIREYSTDEMTANSLLTLLDYYGKDCLMKISEEQALAFLDKLECGEITINEVN